MTTSTRPNLLEHVKPHSFRELSVRAKTSALSADRTSYASRLKEHLSNYKRVELEIAADGECKHRAYSHILPASVIDRNILATIRDEFREYWEKQSRGANPAKVHRCFAHLTSSQALAFNLFFPFLGSHQRDPDLLLRLLGLDEGVVTDWRFEYEPKKEEGTNVDLALFLGKRKVYIEVKLTEAEFGTCKDDRKHREKLKEYIPDLEGKVSPELFTAANFFPNYQVLRYMSHLDSDKVHVVFLFPQANESLHEADQFIRTVPLGRFKKSVSITYLETFIEAVLAETKSDSFLHRHFEAMAKKYLPAPLPAYTRPERPVPLRERAKV